jgi:ActR/RegA family two-component response regulator
VRLTATGDLDAVVKAVADHAVVDLLSQPADLEEIFLTFYRDREDGTGTPEHPDGR